MNKDDKTNISNFKIKELYPDGTVKETYHEQTIRKTLYRVTSVYQGQFKLEKALEDLAVRKILAKIKAGEIE